MTRWWFAVALVTVACGKDKPADVAPGSGTQTGSATVSIAPPVLPTVPGAGYEANPPTARVSVSPAGVVVDGKPVAGIESVVGGLSAVGAPRFALELDKTLEARVLGQLLVALTPQGVKNFGLLAQKPTGETVMVPFDLPGAASVAPPTAGSAAPPTDELPTAVVVEVRDVSLTPESSLSAEVAKAKVSQTYLTGLRRCVKTSAETDATGASSFTVTFAISEAGVGLDAKATGVTNAAAACIAQQAATWRFPIPKDADRKGMKVSATATFDVSVDETAVRKPAPGASAPVVAPSAPGLTIAITKDAVAVATKPPIPLASADVAAQLSTQLAGVAQVTVSVEPSTTVQRLAELLGAIRATSSVVLVVE